MERVVRSLLLFQTIILAEAAFDRNAHGSRIGFAVVKLGAFVCMVSMLFCDCQYLPEVFGLMLAFLNLPSMHMKKEGNIAANLSFLSWMSMAVFLLSLLRNRFIQT